MRNRRLIRFTSAGVVPATRPAFVAGTPIAPGAPKPMMAALGRFFGKHSEGARP